MKFSDAVERVKVLSERPNDETLLQLYGLYKQSIHGDCDVAKPYFWDRIGTAKWDSWMSYSGTLKSDAENQYTKLVERLIREDVDRLIKQTE